MTAKKWSEIKHQGIPLDEFRIQLLKEDMIKQYNRPWWRLVRWWDRRRGRGEA